MPVNKAKGQTDGNLKVLFKLLDTGGTPTIVQVSPAIAAGDISVTDTATGRATVVIKNFKGPQGAINAQAQSLTTSVNTAVVAISYSGNDLTFELSSEDDASTLTDTSVHVCVEAF